MIRLLLVVALGLGAPAALAAPGDRGAATPSHSVLRGPVLGATHLALSAAAYDPWWGSDKALHLTVGVGLGATCYAGLWLLSRDPAWLRATLCAGATALPALGKELYDSGRPGNDFSGKDLFWSLLGAWVTTAVGLAVELIVGSLVR